MRFGRALIPDVYMDIILIKIFKARCYQHWKLEKLSSSVQ